ncbi:hypothetical protein LJK87_04700 [Paenibacillus sp. P25]|nr:hypothetical protein LJK87_04700 [Paenibacillus sp. P25]
MVIEDQLFSRKHKRAHVAGATIKAGQACYLASLHKFFWEVVVLKTIQRTKLEGLSEKIFLDRYAMKNADTSQTQVGDTVLVLTKDDPKFPAKEVGEVIERQGKTVKVKTRKRRSGGVHRREADADLGEDARANVGPFGRRYGFRRSDSREENGMDGEVPLCA